MSARVASAPAAAPRRTASAAPAPAAPVATTTAPDLKYLAFFRSAVIEIYLFLIQIYEHLKEKSGSFKPGIESVEGTVKTVVGPVISRIDFAPDEYLKFVDAKVDSTIQFAQDHTPEDVKIKAVAVYEYLSKVPEKAQVAVEEYNKKGAAATAKEYYEYYLPLVLSYLEALWKFVLTLPMAPQVVNAAQPFAVLAAQKYNTLLLEAKKSDIAAVKSAALYLPAVPVEKLKKVE